MSTFLDEIKEHPVMKDLHRTDPATAQAYVTMFTKAYNLEWNDFIEERDRLRYINEQPGMAKSDFKQVACLPPFMNSWFRFINVGHEPSKDFLRAFIKTHPVFWVKKNAFTK